MYSTYDRFKWSALRDAAHIDNGSAVYADVKRGYPQGTDEENDQLVQKALLELLDDGLIFFYWSDWDNGVMLDAQTAPRASRAEIEAELARGGSAPAKEETVWFAATETGRDVLDGLPRKAFLD